MNTADHLLDALAAHHHRQGPRDRRRVSARVHGYGCDRDLVRFTLTPFDGGLDGRVEVTCLRSERAAVGSWIDLYGLDSTECGLPVEEHEHHPPWGRSYRWSLAAWNHYWTNCEPAPAARRNR